MSEPFEVEGLDGIQKLVDRFVSREFMAASKAAMTQTLIYLHGEIPEYPVQSHTPQAQGWTPKQRRYFFWALKEGLISVPYRRSGTMGRKFTTQVEQSGVVTMGAIGTDSEYAPWVVGPDKSRAITIGGVNRYQTWFHKDVWWSFEEVVESNLDAAYTIFVTEFFKYLEAVA